jgi:hypothetical protein
VSIVVPAFHGFIKPAAAGGGGFVPTDEATLDWWLTAESLSLSDNDPVVDWLDSSPAGKHYGQNTGGVQPTYKINILNGRPVVRFAGGDKVGADPLARTYGPANTMILVCTPSSTTNSYIFGGDGGGGIPAFISGFGGKSFEYYNSGSERATFAASTSGFHILTLTRTDDTGNAVGYFDGASAFSIAVDTSLDWNANFVSEVGTNGAAGGEDPYNGDIAQILHCSSVLDATGLNNMHTYLSDLYGISITLI